MAEQITNYQCPACTGPLQFSAATGKLECEYCGSSFEVAQIEALYAQKEEKAAQAMAREQEKEAARRQEESQWDTSALSEDWGEDAQGMRAYNCPSCGAQLICEQTTAASSCPYCGNPSVVPGQFSGALKPDYVIPFRVRKEQAKEALLAHYKGKLFLPKTFRTQQQLEKVQGIYVPFWLFDGQATGDCSFDTTSIHFLETPSKRTTITRHYQVQRGGSIAFEKVPVDASSKMPDGHMDAIEPFDYAGLKPFSTAYLPGFLADKYDVTVEDSQQRADSRCGATLRAALEQTVTGYDTCVLRDQQVQIQRGKVHYAMLPVWLMHVKWHSRDFLFAINGQTGKLVGDLPVDWAKAAGLFAAIAVPLAVAGNLLVRLIFG